MNLLSALRVAARTLLLHKGRSALTSLGIVIGISAVIVMVAAGEGARWTLDDRMGSIGKNLVLVRSGARAQSGAVADQAPLRSADAALVRRHLGPLLRGVALVQLTQRTVSSSGHSGHNWPTTICGTTPDMKDVREWRLAAGRYFTEDEVRRAADVCVIGETIRRKLWPTGRGTTGRDVIGQTVRVDRLRLRVVGLLLSKGKTPAGGDQDDEMFIPLTTLQRKLVGEERVVALLTAVRDESQISRVVEEMTRLLRDSHRVRPGQEDFDVASVREMAEVGYVVTDTMQQLIVAVASLSLLVGGIGIMNIMLVSVTERTQEIGLRMAVGATAADVLRQFLIEAVVLATLGGLVGVAVGVTAAAGLASVAGWPVIVGMEVIALAFGAAAGVGVFFGFYPAWRASRLDPIDALRHE